MIRLTQAVFAVPLNDCQPLLLFAWEEDEAPDRSVEAYGGAGDH